MPAAKIPADVAKIEPVSNTHVPEEILAGEVTRLVTGVPLAKTPTSPNVIDWFAYTIKGRINPPSGNTVITLGIPPMVPIEATPSLSNDASRTPSVLILNALVAYDVVPFANDEI